MKIASLRCRLPSERLSNDDMIAWLRSLLPAMDAQEFDRLESRIRIGYRLAGSQYRYINRAPVDVMDELAGVAGEALADAGIAAADLDLIIYVGVGRGCLEPASAALLHKRLGADGAAAFDILDACVSWVRGLEVAQALIAASNLKNVLLVNCEMGMQAFGALADLTPENLDLYFSTLTVGEAATACVLQPGGADFEFHGRTFSQGFEYCMLPLANADRFLTRELPDAALPNRYLARSTALVRAGLDGIERVWFDAGQNARPAPDLTLAHSVSERASREALRRLGLDPGRHLDIHASHGNTVSASIPLGLCLAREAGRLNPGDEVVLFGAGAGVTVSICRFVYRD